jgi:hypothetical protein
MLPTSDGPPAPTNVDIEIARNNGESVATEATQECLQASKSIPTLSLTQTIEQRIRENGRLRQELAYQHRKHAASLYFFEEVKPLVERLQLVVINFHNLLKQIEDEFA